MFCLAVGSTCCQSDLRIVEHFLPCVNFSSVPHTTRTIYTAPSNRRSRPVLAAMAYLGYRLALSIVRISWMNHRKRLFAIIRPFLSPPLYISSLSPDHLSMLSIARDVCISSVCHERAENGNLQHRPGSKVASCLRKRMRGLHWPCCLLQSRLLLQLRGTHQRNGRRAFWHLGNGAWGVGVVQGTGRWTTP